MSVEFEGDRHQSFVNQEFDVKGNSSGMIGFFISRGIAKDLAQANQILAGIMIICMITTIGVVYYNSRGSGRELSPEQQEALLAPLSVEHYINR